MDAELGEGNLEEPGQDEERRGASIEFKWTIRFIKLVTCNLNCVIVNAGLFHFESIQVISTRVESAPKRFLLRIAAVLECGAVPNEQLLRLLFLNTNTNTSRLVPCSAAVPEPVRSISTLTS